MVSFVKDIAFRSVTLYFSIIVSASGTGMVQEIEIGRIGEQ